MSRPKSVGVYERDDYRPIEVFTTKKKAIEYLHAYEVTTATPAYADFFYYVHPDQLSVLNYAQARELEMILKFATEETREKNF